jgi:hypothetical protein
VSYTPLKFFCSEIAFERWKEFFAGSGVEVIVYPKFPEPEIDLSEMSEWKGSNKLQPKRKENEL